MTLLEDFGVKDAKVRIGMDANAAMGMVQRVGLGKVRHVEVDVLWIQEQQARRLLPLEKIPGAKNQSDLCTKNIPAALIDQYLEQLNVYYAVGRATVAQQLHALGPLSPVIAHPSVGARLVGKIGGGKISESNSSHRVNASSPGGDLLVEVTGGSVRAWSSADAR